MSTTDTPATEQTFEQQVNTVAGAMVQGEDGNFSLPEDVEATPEVKFAATLEKRRRDTQSAYSKGQDELKRLATENEQLASNWAQDTVSSLTAEQTEELATLKHEDPDAWREKLNEYEEANRTSFKEKRAEISTSAQKETELDKRNRLLAEFSESNPEITLTDEVIANDLPPRYIKKLEAGESTFEEFLADCKGYLTKNKVIADNPAPDTVSLSKTSGTSLPEESAVRKDITQSYNTETY